MNLLSVLLLMTALVAVRNMLLIAMEALADRRAAWAALTKRARRARKRNRARAVRRDSAPDRR